MPTPTTRPPAIARRGAAALFAASMLFGVAACGDDDAGNDGDELQEDVNEGVDDVQEGVDDAGDEIDQQIDEGTEEDGETSD